MPPTSTLTPTWNGFVSDTREALILFEATLQGSLHRVTRRPHDRERSALIRSGSVFIYEEGASGIKRWTDGVSWSPSRILNNFLIYRELQKPFAPGEKKRAKPKGKQAPDSDDSDLKREESDSNVASPITPQSATESPQVKSDLGADRDATRSLVGSLTDSYAFKQEGLVKKTMSVVVQGSHFHLVSYYKPEDVTANSLTKPMDTDLRFTKVRSELVTRQNFRAPIEDGEEMVPASQYGAPLPRTPYNVGQPFIPPEYMHHTQHHEGYPQPPGHFSKPMQQHAHEAFADPRHAMQLQSPTHIPSPTQGPLGAYMPQLPQLPMRPEYGQYQHQQQQHQQHQHQQQEQYAEQQRRMGLEQQQQIEQQRYIERQRQQHGPHGPPQQQAQPPPGYARHQQQQQVGGYGAQMQMPPGWSHNQMGP